MQLDLPPALGPLETTPWAEQQKLEAVFVWCFSFLLFLFIFYLCELNLDRLQIEFYLPGDSLLPGRGTIRWRKTRPCASDPLNSSLSFVFWFFFFSLSLAAARGSAQLPTAYERGKCGYVRPKTSSI